MQTLETNGGVVDQAATQMMNVHAQQGWRVVAVTPWIDFSSRGRGVTVTYERG